MKNIANIVSYLFVKNISWRPSSVIKYLHKNYMRIQGMVSSVCMYTDITCMFTSELSYPLSP